ncbi:MAG: TonB-dependent receptor [Pseudomonadota bacterium]
MPNSLKAKSTLLCTFLALAIYVAGPITVYAKDNQEETKYVQIEAQPLSSALLEFTKTYGVAVSGDGALLQNKITSAISGNYTPQAALKRMLKNSGLHFRFGKNGGFVISEKNESAAVELSTLSPKNTSVDQAQVEVIVVEGLRSYAGGLVSRDVRVGILGDKEIFDLPISVSSFTRDFIDSQNPLTANDLLRRDAAYRSTSPRTGGADGGIIRGFRSEPFEAKYDGGQSVFFRRVPLEIVERVDIIKGPGTLQNGPQFNAGAGGVVNYQSKKPTDSNSSRLHINYQSQDIVGGHLDVNRTLDDDGVFAARANLAYRSGESAVNRVDEEDHVAHLALQYLEGPVRLNTQYGYYYNNTDSTLFGIFLADPTAPLPDPIRNDEFAAADPAYAETQFEFLHFRGQYDFNEDWTFDATLATSWFDEDFVTIFISGTDSQGNVPEGSSYFPQLGRTEFGDYVTSEFNLRGKYELFGVKHNVAFSANYTIWKQQFSNAFFTENSLLPAFNIYDPDRFIDLPVPIISENIQYFPFSDETLFSAGVVDDFALLNDSLLVTAGIRFSRIERKIFAFGAPSGDGSPTEESDTTHVSPGVGLVYKPNDTLSFYSSYFESMERGTIAPAIAVNAGESTDPVIGKQIEIGMKADFDNFGTTAAIFEITRDFSFLDSSTLVFETFGEQRHRGLELSAFGVISDNIRIIASYSLIDPELTKTEGGTTDGQSPPGVSEHGFAFSAEFDISNSVTAIANLNYNSAQFSDITNTQEIDGFTRIDIGARYGFLVGETEMQLSLKIDNVLGEDYWEGFGFGGLQSGVPRRVTVQLRADF